MSYPTPVTDPDVLSRFNSAPKPVDDPDVLARFNSTSEPSLAHEAAAIATSPVKGLISLGGVGGDLSELAKKGAAKITGGKASDFDLDSSAGGARDSETPLPPKPGPIWEADSLLDWLKKSYAYEQEAAKRQPQIGHGDLPGSYANRRVVAPVGRDVHHAIP